MGVTHKELKAICDHASKEKEKYWTEVAQKVVWTKKWTKVLDDSNSPFTKWFVDGELNLCYNCVDRHVADGFGDMDALIFDSPVTGTSRRYTYSEVLQQVSLLGGVLSRLRVTKGDVVLICMPMMPEGAFAMLACARVGALHACVPSGLPAFDLSLRVDHSKPKVIITASYGFHVGGWKNYKTEVDEACERANHKPEKILVLQRGHRNSVVMTEGRDVDWLEEMKSATATPCVPMEANEPQFMVYTSGSTGAPKAIVHSVGGFTVRMMVDAPLLYGDRSQAEEVFFATSNYGWIVGHSIVLYGPLIGKIPTVIFEGDPLLTDDVRTLYRILSDNKVTRCLVRPGVLKLLKGKDFDGIVSSEFNLESVKHFFTAGEKVDMKTMQWVASTFQTPFWNAWGQSETGTIATGFADSDKSTPQVADFGAPSPGWDFTVMKPDGTEGKAYEIGRILLRLPLPPGGLLTIFENEELFKKTYFNEYPGFYDTKDEGFLDDNGYLKVENRMDDIMKVGQIYLAAQAVEEVILSHSAIAECVVVSTTDLVWKEIPVALYMKKQDSTQAHEEVAKDLNQLVFNKYGVSVKFGGSVLVKELPRTRTGKVHRPSCNALARGQIVNATGAVENPHVFEEITAALKAANYGKNVLLE